MFGTLNRPRSKRRQRNLDYLRSVEDGVIYSDADVSNPPTDAELDAEFGAPSTVGAGFVAILADSGGSGPASNVYLVASDGASWWHEALTKAT